MNGAGDRPAGTLAGVPAGVLTGGAGVVVDVGVATQSMPGFSLCGDGWAWAPRQDGLLFAVVDGLGHGDDAHAAAELARALLHEHADDDLVDLVKHVHDGLKRSRGVVMSAALVDALALSWIGVGNVEGIVIRGPQSTPGSGTRDALSCRGGVVGYKLPTLRAHTTVFGGHDTLVFSTDGLRAGFQATLDDNEPVQHEADRLLRDFASGDDDALVCVVRRHAGAAGAGGAGA